MANILMEFTVEAPVSTVYKAITEGAEVKGWWTVDNNLKPQQGSMAEFRFAGSGGFKFEVSKLDKDKGVVWKTIEGLPDWGGTQVTFDLEAKDGGTKVVFGHRDFATEAGSFGAVSYAWAGFMMSLKSYIETGQGKPYSGEAN